MERLRRSLPKIVTGGIAVGLYLAALPPATSARDIGALSAALHLVPTYLEPADNGQPLRSRRVVHPDIERIDAWISSVGSGIALADIQGSGRPADICLVDPRNDSVSIIPAPETGPRFLPFALATPSEGYLAATIAPMGCLPGDLNEDGRMDLLVYYWGRTPLLFLRNDESTLSPSAFDPLEIVDQREIWNTNAAMLADVDGDGHPDLFFGNYFQDGARVLDPAAGDRFEMQHSMSRADNAGRNRLLLWKKASPTSVDYEDFSATLSQDIAQGWTLAVGARDLNGDLLPEIYVANDFGPDRLLLNRSSPGDPKFSLVEGRRSLTMPRSKVLGRDSFKGMGVDFGDVSGSNRPAIAVSNISSPYALLESHFLFVNTGEDEDWDAGVAPYVDESGSRGTWISNWAWDLKFADLTNSGRLSLFQAIGFLVGENNRWPQLQELAMGNDELLANPKVWPRFSGGDDLSGQDHDRLFVPDESGVFRDVWSALGLDSGTASRGIATGDVYGDGRLAVAISRQWGPSLFLRNLSTAGQAIVVDLRLKGDVGGTRAAIGAQARLTLADGRVVTSIVDGGNGHSGKRAPEIHLGLGDVPLNQAFKVQFTWRDSCGVQEDTRQLMPGRHLVVLEGRPCSRGGIAAVMR